MVFLPIPKYLAREIDTMSKKVKSPGWLRIAAAIILGCIVGSVIFLIVALGIGVINDRMGMQIPIDLLIGENLFSAILLVLFIVISSAGFCWQVWKTPSSDNDL
jgi:uncharacterized protein YqhQ